MKILSFISGVLGGYLVRDAVFCTIPSNIFEGSF